MGKMFWVVLIIFIIICLGYIYLFYTYLYGQYKKATINFYKKELNLKKYCVTSKENYRKSRIKNNITQIIDHHAISSLTGYAILEFIDNQGRIVKTQTIFTPNLRIGREESNDIVLHEQTVSRNQCLIRRQNNKFFMCNLSKTNPTIVNGESIENTTDLYFGDTIKIADYTLRFQKI